MLRHRPEEVNRLYRRDSKAREATRQRETEANQQQAARTDPATCSDASGAGEGGLSFSQPKEPVPSPNTASVSDVRLANPGAFSLASHGLKNTLSALLPFYVSDQKAIETAHATYGGPQGLLRGAAGAIEQAGANDRGESPRSSGDHETDALTRFARRDGLMMDAEKVRQFMAEHPMIGGSEHRVASVFAEGRVLKDLDAHAIATESVFDYLTDHLLANYFFGDDIRLEGFYQHQDRLHIITSQPFIDGTHPDWAGLVTGLENQGLRHDAPNSKTPTFLIDGGPVGIIDVIDLHENNVVAGKQTGLLHPIDAHFYFDSRAARIAALKALGIDPLRPKL